MSGKDKPIDLDKRRKLLGRMATLERQMRELRREFATPEQLSKLVLGELEQNVRACKTLAESFHRSELWVLDMLVLWGVYLKLQGKEPDPSDALAMFTKNSAYAKDSFKAAVLARLAQLEDELIK